MNKKAYINPAMETIEVKTTGMLAVSGVQFNGDGSGSVTPQNGDATSEGLSPSMEDWFSF